MNQAFTRLIASFSESAQDHLNLSDAITAQITEALKIAERKAEEEKKKVRLFTSLGRILTSGRNRNISRGYSLNEIASTQIEQRQVCL